MGTGSVGVVAAMPQEIAPLLRRIGSYRKQRVAGCNLYLFELSGVPVALIESGMGPRHAAAATAALIERTAPDLLVNFGFAGAVLPELQVGDLVVAERVLLFEGGVLSELPRPDAELGRRVSQALAALPLPAYRGSFITAAAITNKQALAGLLDSGTAHPVLEMETAALRREAGRAGIPVIAVRGISDAAQEELDFSLEEFCDAELQIRLPRVLWTVARKPWIIPQLIRLSGNTRRAGEKLAEGVYLVLETLCRGMS